MSAFMRRFEATYPSAQVTLDYMHPAQVYEAVEQGAVDLGLISYPEESRIITAMDWRTEPLVVVCPPGHPLAGREVVDIADLAGESFITFEADLRIRAEIDRALMVEQVDVNVTHEFDNIEMIKRDIEGGAGISILPEPTVEKEVQAGALVTIPLSDKSMVRPLGIINHRDRLLNHIGKQFVNLLCADNDFVHYHSENGYKQTASTEQPRK